MCAMAGGQVADETPALILLIRASGVRGWWSCSTRCKLWISECSLFVLHRRHPMDLQTLVSSPFVHRVARTYLSPKLMLLVRLVVVLIASALAARSAIDS